MSTEVPHAPLAPPPATTSFQPHSNSTVNPINGSNPLTNVEGRTAVIAKPPPPPPKRTTPLFTLADQRKGEVRSPLVRVKNEAVLQAIVPKPYDDPPLFAPVSLSAAAVEPATTNSTRPHLGRVIYTPFVNPATLVDGEVLRNKVGGSIEVVIDIGWLEGVGFELGDPESFDGTFSDGALSFPLPLPTVSIEETSTIVTNGDAPIVAAGGEEKSIFDLEPFRKRKVWGTDVYTDDSDLLCICLHSGWLRLLPSPTSLTPPSTTTKSASPSTSTSAGATAMDLDSAAPKVVKFTGGSGGKRSGSIIVKMVVAPTLLRYQSSVRQSLKSRNWGNGHDGVSLMIESVDFVQVSFRSFLLLSAVMRGMALMSW